MKAFNKIILAGGSGQIGKALADYFRNKCESIIILSRKPALPDGIVKTLLWDGKTVGDWYKELENADILINLAGKNVNCRYNEKNKKEIIDSRVNSVEVLITAIAKCVFPPKLWIQTASATIYRHAEDKPMTENEGEIGEGFSVNVCKAWEGALTKNTKSLEKTRKVILRTSLVLSKNDGVFPRIKNLVRFGLGGKQGNGRQMMSWIHEQDVCRMVEWLALNKNMEGVFNCTAPEPLTNKSFMKIIRNAFGKTIALPAPGWLLEIGAVLIGTETELVLKSRWVIPQRAQQNGFEFLYPNLQEAVNELVIKKTRA